MEQKYGSGLSHTKQSYEACDIIAEANFFHIVTDDEFIILNMNQWALTHLNSQAKNSEPSSIFDLFNVNESQKEDILGQIENKNQIQNINLKLLIGNGIIYTMWNIKKTHMSNGNKNYFHFFGHDVTEQKKLEIQLAQSEKLSAIGQMAAGLAHDISKPLNSLSSLIQILENHNSDNFTLAKLKIMDTQIEYLVKKVHQLVDLGRPMKGNKEKLNINTVLLEAIRIIKYDRLLSDITIKTVFCPDKYHLYISFDHLLQVFINVILNAGYALQNTQYPAIIVSTSCQESSIRIDIQDNGEGIEPKLLPHVFEPFMTTKKDKDGTGLGLWMCHNFISSINGKIRLDSNVNVGTNVQIELPISRENHAK